MHHQPGYSQGHSGPPPAKRSKGNPLITRYPPPPGYVPGQPSPWQQAHQAQQAYGYPSGSYPGYPPQPYGASPPYQLPQVPGSQQPGYYTAPTTGYSAPPSGWQAPSPAPHSAPPRPPPAAGLHSGKRRHNSAPYSRRSWSGNAPLDGNGDPLPPAEPSVASSDDLESDFDAECYFARHPDEIDPAFSLGLIEWHPPLPTKSALPPTFKEADLEALAQRKSRPNEEDSISEYFTRDRRDEAFLSVRQTDYWEEVKDDLIFREFSVLPEQLLTMYELIEQYRDRPDPNWAKQTSMCSRESTPLVEERPSNEQMDMCDDSASSPHMQPAESIEQSDVVTNLEQTLLASDRANGHRHGSHSRAASVSSTAGERITRPKPLPLVRDQAQEDILAALGVTGSPRLVYETPGPAFGAPAAADAKSRQNSVSSSHDDHHPDGSDATPRPKYNHMESRKRSHGEFACDESDEPTPRQERCKQLRAEDT